MPIHLKPLRRILKRFATFCVVGASGVVVNAGLFHLLVRTGGLDYRIASLMAIETAIINNFIWNFFWTYGDRKATGAGGIIRNLVRFNFSSGLTAMIVNWGILVALKEACGIHEEIANFIGIAAGTMANFLLSHFWVFRKKQTPG